MRFVITYIILSLFNISLYAQNPDLKIREISKQLDYELNIIDSLKYHTVSKTNQETRIIPVSELEFTRKYPMIFVRNKNCYDFKSNKNERIKVCNYDSTKNLRERENYEFKGQYCDFALIYVSGYEFWGFISVDLNNGNAFYTMGIPKTIDCKISLSHSNYYREEEIAITDLTSKNQLVLGIEDWTTEETKKVENEYYIKLKTYLNLKLVHKYIKIKITGHNNAS